MENGMEMEWKILAHDRWNGKKLECKVEWNGMEFTHFPHSKVESGMENIG